MYSGSYQESRINAYPESYAGFVEGAVSSILVMPDLFIDDWLFGDDALFLGKRRSRGGLPNGTLTLDGLGLTLDGAYLTLGVA